MNNPEMLVNIKKEKINRKKTRKDPIKIDEKNNPNLTTIASTITNGNTNNDNLQTTNTINTISTENNKFEKDNNAKNNIIKKESKKKNKKINK